MTVSCHAAPLDLRPASIVETLGGPEVAHIFAHDVAAAVPREGFSYAAHLVARWPERALVMARPHDVVCVVEPVDEAFVSFLTRLGLGPGVDRVVVADSRTLVDPQLSLAEQLRRNGEALDAIRLLLRRARHVVVDPFITTEADRRLAQALARRLGRPVTVQGGDPAVVARVNRKDYVRTKAEELGVPLAGGEVVELSRGPDGRPRDTMALEAALRRQVRATGRALVRGACGASGSATFVAEAGRAPITAVLESVAAATGNSVYLIDPMHDVRVSPNILMHMEPAGGRIAWVGASDQCLDAALVHRGNTYPSRARSLGAMVRCAHRLACWLQDEGFVGLVGFDFCDLDGGRDDFFLAEVNARVNGAAYPTFLLDSVNQEQARHRRPPVRAFLSVQTLTTPARSFADLAVRHAASLFEPATGRGCIPFNTGQLPFGRCSGVFFGPSAAAVAEMHQAWLADASAR